MKKKSIFVALIDFHFVLSRMVEMVKELYM